MDIRSKKFLIIAAITFVILFLMNYVGNNQPDKLERALLTAVAGVAGLTIGMWFVNRNKDSRPPEHFD